MMTLQLIISACASDAWEPEPNDLGEAASELAQNVALGKAVTASSYAQVYVASNANDGNRETYWEGAPNAYPGTLTVNLGGNHDISSVVLQLSANSLWATRTQSITVLGHNATTSSFSTWWPRRPTPSTPRAAIR